MMKTSPPFIARSWLFAPGDSEKKMTKAADGGADIVLLDLEDSVSPENKPAARKSVAKFLASRSDRGRLWVRINLQDARGGTGESAADLAAIMPARPGGIMLPKSEGRHHVEQLDRELSALELEHGIESGSTKVIALVTETPSAMFTAGDYAGAPRLVGMTWGAEDLSSALGASEMFESDGSFAHTYELARSLCLLGAAAAEVLPVETIQSDFGDLDGLKARAEKCWRAGYRGMLAIHPAQVDLINQAFSPSDEETEQARAIVQAFADNPGAGTVGLNGKMLDRPHLVRARGLLALANALAIKMAK